MADALLRQSHIRAHELHRDCVVDMCDDESTAVARIRAALCDETETAARAAAETETAERALLHRLPQLEYARGVVELEAYLRRRLPRESAVRLVECDRSSCLLFEKRALISNHHEKHELEL